MTGSTKSGGGSDEMSSALPLMVVFLFLQRYFMEGLTVGALKG
jgi:ABC-type maltose transport system permease subunit